MNISLYKNIGNLIRQENVKYYPRSNFNIALTNYHYTTFTLTGRGKSDYIPQSIRVAIDKQTLITEQVDYVRLYKDGRYYYCFVDAIIYINDEVSEIAIVVDVLNTYNFVVKSAKLIRGHVNRWKSDSDIQQLANPIYRDNISNFEFKSKPITVFDSQIKEVYQKGNGDYAERVGEFSIGVACVPLQTGTNWGNGYQFFIHYEWTTPIQKNYWKDDGGDIIEIGYYTSVPVQVNKLFTYAQTRFIYAIPYWPEKPHVETNGSGTTFRNVINHFGEYHSVEDNFFTQLSYNKRGGNNTDILGTRILDTIDTSRWVDDAIGFDISLRPAKVDIQDEDSDDTLDPNLLQYYNFRIGRRDTYIPINFKDFNREIALRYTVASDNNLTITIRALATSLISDSPYDKWVSFEKPVTLPLMSDTWQDYERANSNNNDTVKALYSIVGGLTSSIGAFAKSTGAGVSKSIGGAMSASSTILSQKDNKENLQDMGVSLKSFGTYSYARDTQNFNIYYMHDKYPDEEIDTLVHDVLRYGYTLPSFIIREDEQYYDFMTTNSVVQPRKLFNYAQLIDVKFGSNDFDSTSEMNTVALLLGAGATFARLDTNQDGTVTMFTDFYTRKGNYEFF